MRINSIIFHTSRLSEIRAFYEEKLQLPIGTYIKENANALDCSDTYVNYDLDGVLLCFETDSNRTDVGTIVLSIKNFSEFKTRIEKMDIKIVAGSDHYFKIKDPDGRSLIIEPIG